jgi:hypothetical protein
MNTIEEINVSQDLIDTQKTLNGLNPKNLLLNYFIPGMEYNFRLLGTFVTIKRLYLPSSNKLHSIDLLKIFNGNEDYYTKVMKELAEKDKSDIEAQGTQGKSLTIPGIDYRGSHNYGWYTQTTTRYTQTDTQYRVQATHNNDSDTITKLYKKQGWSKGVLANALFKSGTSYNDIKVICISPIIMNSMMQCRTNGDISGLFAHDITLRKNGSGMSSTYDVRISQNPLFLDKETIEYVYNNGLIDIKTLISSINNLNLQQNTSKLPTYIYNEASDYKMPKELSNIIFKDFVKEEESKHFEEVDENIADIPRESFENMQEINNSMFGIELD